MGRNSSSQPPRLRSLPPTNEAFLQNVKQVHLSDHLPNFAMLISTSNRLNFDNRPLIRLHTKKNRQQFQDKLSLTNWSDALYCSDNVNSLYNTFITIIKEIYENCFPLTRLSRRAMRDKKWFTNGLKNSIKEKMDCTGYTY